MDTNIADRIEIQVEDADASLSHVRADEDDDRLRAFRTIEAGEKLNGEPNDAPPIKRGPRNGSMIGVCTAAVLVTTAGMFWISPHNHYTFRDAKSLATHVRDIALNSVPKPPPPIAPAAQLARAPSPTASPIHYRPVPPKPQSVAGGDDMAEFLRLGGQAADPQPAAPVPPTAPKPVPVVANLPTSGATPEKLPAEVSVHGAEPHQVTVSTTTARAAAAPPDMPAVEAVKPVEPASPEIAPAAHEPAPPKPVAPMQAASPPGVQQDAVAKIAALRPAPMTDPQQLQVLQLVTELGTLVRDQRAEIAQLRQDQQNLDQRVDGSLTDFGRRLSLAEARGAISAAMGVQTAPIQPATGPAAAPAAIPAVVKASMPAPVAVDTTPHRYHIQAASPGLAMLSALDASGGEDAQLPVAPGDDVPGWGKVISISQRGDTWVVKTEHGLIQ